MKSWSKEFGGFCLVLLVIMFSVWGVWRRELGVWSLVLVIMFSACSRSVNKNKTETAVKLTQTALNKDSSFTKSEAITVQTTAFGDSLYGNMTFVANDSLQADSMESAGLKIKGTLVKTSYGHKLNVSAVAKPVQTTSKSHLTTETKNYIDKQSYLQTDSSAFANHKIAETQTAAIQYWWLWLILVAVALYIYWRYLK
jgi:hypothetical protein